MKEVVLLARAVLGSLALLSSPLAFAAEPLDLPFTLTVSPGKGPFPAVVILHDCSGLGPKSSGGPWRWATQLTAKGYVTIWPDSFSTRGHADGVCTDASPPIISFAQRADDAYAALASLASGQRGNSEEVRPPDTRPEPGSSARAALAHLQTLPNVDARRIAVMGGSHGGSSTLATVVDTAANSNRNAPRLAAAIALYPGCGRSIGDWSVERARDARHKITGYSGVFKPLAPLLILTGDLDDWTPAEPCRRLAAASRQAGHPVEITVYAGAHHSFDSRAPIRFVAERRNQNSPSGRGATTGGNAQAWADAITRVEEFLGKHLAHVPEKWEPVFR
jgi:dienelactone hydrolase